jgi:hypothetical protein
VVSTESTAVGDGSAVAAATAIVVSSTAAGALSAAQPARNKVRAIIVVRRADNRVFIEPLGFLNVRMML